MFFTFVSHLGLSTLDGVALRPLLSETLKGFLVCFKGVNPIKGIRIGHINYETKTDFTWFFVFSAGTIDM